MANRKRAKREFSYGSAKHRAETHESSSGVSSFKVPDDMPLFQVKKAGIYKFDIVPFIVDKTNPMICPGKLEPGNLWYERTFFVHRGIGPEQKSYCCLARTFKKRCPICEDILSMRRSSDPDPELLKNLQPKERQLFLIIDRNDADSGVQLWEYSFHNFGKILDEKIKASDEEDGYENFYYLEGGMTLKVSFKEETMGKNKFFKCSNIEMRPRKEDLSEDPDTLPKLDELPIQLTYDKLKALYEMSDGDEEEDEDKPRGGKKKVAAKSKDKDEDEDEDEDLDDDEPEDEDEDEDIDDEDEPEEKPVPKRKPGRPKKVKEPEPEEDDDDSDDDEDEDEDDEGDDEDSDGGDEDDEDDDAFDDEDEDEEPPPPKRKPGRPKKK